MIVGVILLQTAIFAPTRFEVLNEESAGKLIRVLFPKFFLLLSVLGACSLLAPLQYPATSWQLGIALISISLPVICLALIPRTNHARDTGDKKTFDRLHRVSVMLTVTVFVVNLALP